LVCAKAARFAFLIRALSRSAFTAYLVTVIGTAGTDEALGVVGVSVVGGSGLGWAARAW